MKTYQEMNQKEITLKERIYKVAGKAEKAFWEEVTKEFSEVKTGNLDMISHSIFEDAIEKAITAWLKQNANYYKNSKQ